MNINRPLSPSGMDTYLTCPAQFNHNYIRKTQRRPNQYTHVGSLFHEAVEYFVEGQYVRTFADCTYYAVAHPADFSRPPFKPAEIKEVIEIGEKWLAGGQFPLPDPNKIHSTETSFGPPGDKLGGIPVDAEVSFDSGLRIHGIMDVIWVDETGTVVIGDYKTQKAWLTPNELSTKVQAMAYALVAHQFTSAPIRVEFYLVRYPEDGPVTWVPGDEDWEIIEHSLWGIQQRILNDKDAPAQPGEMCQFCSYNYACDPYKDWTKSIPVQKSNKRNLKDLKNIVGNAIVLSSAVEDDIRRILSFKEIATPGLFEAMDIDELVHEVNELYFKKRSNETAYEHARKLLHARMDRENITSIGKWEITRKLNTYYSGEAKVIADSYGGSWKLPPTVKAQLAPFATQKWTKPYLWRNWKKKETLSVVK